MTYGISVTRWMRADSGGTYGSGVLRSIPRTFPEWGFPMALRHAVAVLAAAAALPLEIAILQQAFDDRMLAAVDAQDRYDIEFAADAPWGRLATADTIVIPAIEDPAGPDPALLDALRDAHVRKARLVAFGSGVFLLGHAGILDGRRATDAAPAGHGHRR